MIESGDVEGFLSDFADTFNLNQAQNVVNFFMLPSIIIDGDHRKVLSDKQQLAELFVNFGHDIRSNGVVRIVPIINQTMRLSSSLFFSNMRWQFMDEQNDIVVSCAASYTIQRLASKELKIIITVIDDNEKQLEKIYPILKRV